MFVYEFLFWIVLYSWWYNLVLWVSCKGIYVWDWVYVGVGLFLLIVEVMEWEGGEICKLCC